MATINDLIARIQDPDLRQRIEKEVKELTKQKKFGRFIPELRWFCHVVRAVAV